MTPKAKRMMLVLLAGLILASAAWLASTALRDNIVFFVTPSQITDEHRTAKRLRLGGLVAKDSVQINGTATNFTITDQTATIKVSYEGALPDLFREGQGVVAQGAITNGIFIADNVLAKHDETYMPREVRDQLEAQGVWQGTEPNS